MSLKNPIKFLDAYTREDIDIFFGRGKETSVLFEKVGKSKVVLLYGLSGTGKTSLINCGLENKFETDQRNFIYVRRGANILNSFRQAVDVAARSLIHPDNTTAETLEILYYDYLKSIIVVFDQFEELFISGADKEREDFIEMIAGILNTDPHVKIIFSLREEYLAYMDKFEEKIPIIFDHRHRLEKMMPSTLEEVITSIAEKGGIELESKEIPGMIIDNISDRKKNVELPYLQVYLDRLTILIKEDGKKNEFTKELVNKAGKLENVLGTFLDEQINSIAKVEKNEVKQNKYKEAIYSILKQLITPDGTKKQLSFDDIDRGGKLTDSQLKDILTKLEQSRIIKLDEGIYELSHDSLAKNIAEKRTKEEIALIEAIKTLKDGYNEFHRSGRKTKLNSNQLKRIQPYRDKMGLSDDEKGFLKKSQIRQNIFLVLKVIIAFVVIGIFLYVGDKIQESKFKDVKNEADEFIKEANWAEAKRIYEQANKRNIFIGKKGEIKANIKRCDEKNSQRSYYEQWNKLGDSLFDKGNYKNAFQHYNLAKNTGFDTNIVVKIKTKTDEAITEYRKLAEIERLEGHLDLALVLLAEAYLLDTTNTKITELIKVWRVKIKPEAIAQLKSDEKLDSEIKKTLEKLKVIPTY